MDSLYRVQKNDIRRAGTLLADAFQRDPIWAKFFDSESTFDQRGAVFECPIRYCLRYGKVYATSERLEGIAAWALGDYADLTLWRVIRSGAFFSAMRASKALNKLGWNKGRILGPLQADMKANMKERPFIYLMIIGVASENQGRGLGGKLLRALIEKSEQAKVPLYLETATERNVRMYQRLGFRSLNKATLPIINLPQWEMVREPSA
jgi:ribosomal protein S18 acetylase RimI-like enzyme